MKKEYSKATVYSHDLLYTDSLSRKLNINYPKVSISVSEGGHYVSNHILFIGHLKLFAEKENILGKVMDETQRFFDVIRLEVKKKKIYDGCKVNAMVIGVAEGYKYLRISENQNSEVTKETVQRVHKEILQRVENIYKFGLND